LSTGTEGVLPSLVGAGSGDPASGGASAVVSGSGEADGFCTPSPTPSGRKFLIGFGASPTLRDLAVEAICGVARELEAGPESVVTIAGAVTRAVAL
jgi:hypothetical protein